MEGRGFIDNPHALNEPMNMRGVLQFLLIATFFGVRYVFDVLLTPPVLDSLLQGLLHSTVGTVSSALPLFQTCYAPLIPFVLLHIWRCCSAEAMQRTLLVVCSLRLATSLLMNDAVTVGRLTKGDVWPILVPLIRFTRVSSGRVPKCAAHPSLKHWFRGHRYFFCLLAPWLIRCFSLTLILRAIGATPSVPLKSQWTTGMHSSSLGQSSNGDCTCIEAREACTSFVGQPMPCSELRLAREFNTRVMPSLHRATYREVRRAMTEYGLYGSTWHVGHACPDPNKVRKTDHEDHGWNLFAQHAADNVRLGHCLVSCAEAAYTGARHIQCTRSTRCVATCDDPSVTSLGEETATFA
jgi:hypothetical protein